MSTKTISTITDFIVFMVATLSVVMFIKAIIGGL